MDYDRKNMGIFPIKCDVCGEYFCPAYSNVHCTHLVKEVKNHEESTREDSILMENLVKAYRERGECKNEILAIAYHIGMSVSLKEFVWLDEEIERLKKKYNQ